MSYLSEVLDAEELQVGNISNEIIDQIKKRRSGFVSVESIEKRSALGEVRLI